MWADALPTFEALDAAWEAIAAGADPLSVTGIDPGSAELFAVARRAYSPTPVATPEWNPVPYDSTAPDRATHDVPVINRPCSIGPGSDRTPRPWLTWLSAAALLLLTMAAIAYFAVQSSDDQAADPGTPVPTTVPAPAGEQWTSPRGGNGRTGATQDPGPAGPPAIVWRTESLGMQTPVLAGELIVTIDTDGAIEALDRDGVSRWRVDLDLSCGFSNLWCNGLTGEPGRVFYASTTGVVGAVDAATGAPLWQQSVPDASATGGPLIAEDLLVVSIADGGLRAFDAATGSPIWARAGTATTDPWHHGSNAFADGMLFSGFSDGSLTASRIETGEVVWTTKLDVSENEDAGGIMWAAPSTPVVADGIVYVAGFDPKIGFKGALVAFDAATGQEVWRFSGRAPFTAVSPPAVTDGIVYLGDQNGLFFALDAASGQVQWEIDLPAKLNEAPTIGGDTLYLSLADRSLIAVDLHTHELLWAVQSIGQLLGGPVIAGDTIYGVAGDGPLIALRASNP
jgi:outer membrane protein assembly factor BamB